jgi:hypothetical protein
MISWRIAALSVVAMLMVVTAVPVAHAQNNPQQGNSKCLQRTRVDVLSGSVLVCNNATPPECKVVTAGNYTEVRCGAFWAGSTAGAGLGTFGATALGIGLAGGVGVGAAAGAGAFNGSSPPPGSPKH